MASFLSGKELEEKLTDIIWNADQYVILLSPFIKLDDHVRSILDKVKSTHEVYLILVFGKNEDYKQKSFNAEDFTYFKEFKNIVILYNKDLHAKHYCNEKEALITSLNLYDYSMINNVEYGVYFTKNILNPTDKLFEETEKFTDDLVFNKSEVVFLRKPLYKKKLLGLTKTYLESTILHNISDEFFSGKKYEVKHLSEFSHNEFSDMDKKYEVKPQRDYSDIKPDQNENTLVGHNNNPGYCIRCNKKIKYNIDEPLCYGCFSTWARFANEEYPESYCHFTGEPSDGETCFIKPVLSKNWREAQKFN